MKYNLFERSTVWFRSTGRRGTAASAVLLAVALHGFATAGTLSEFTAVYEVEIGGFNVARMERSLTRLDGRRLRFSSVSEPSGLARLFNSDRLVETSEVIFEDGHITAHSYEYLRQGKKEKHRLIDFDMAADRISGNRDGRAWNLEVGGREEAVLDRLSYQLAISLDIADGREHLDYLVADNGRLKAYRFDVVAPETLEIAGRRYATLKLERDLDAPAATEIWLSPDLGYLPVRVLLRDDEGKKTAFELVNYEESLPIAE